MAETKQNIDLEELLNYFEDEEETEKTAEDKFIDGLFEGEDPEKIVGEMFKTAQEEGKEKEEETEEEGEEEEGEKEEEEAEEEEGAEEEKTAESELIEKIAKADTEGRVLFYIFGQKLLDEYGDSIIKEAKVGTKVPPESVTGPTAKAQEALQAFLKALKSRAKAGFEPVKGFAGKLTGYVGKVPKKYLIPAMAGSAFVGGYGVGKIKKKKKKKK